MTKQTTEKIKGLAILIMIAHHFLVYDFGMDFSDIWIDIGRMLKICVAIYAVLSGYGYYFAKEKTVKYGLKKIWGLLQIYWLTLFTLFFPAAVLGGWTLDFKGLVVNLFALGPNRNWNAWYVYFYIFCMLVMPAFHKLIRFKPWVNVMLAVLPPYIIEVAIRVLVPGYSDITLLQDLFNCMYYFGIFMAGYLIAKYDILSKIKLHWVWGLVFMAASLLLRFALSNINTFGFNMDILYATLFVIGGAYFFEGLKAQGLAVFSLLGKYSTGMWFFHGAFFSKYISEWFQPVIKFVPWAPLMYLWVVVLSLLGAFIYQKLLDGIHYIPRLVKRS